VVVDLPKNILMGKATYLKKADFSPRSYNPPRDPDPRRIEEAMELLAHAQRPVFYVGGGVVNAGPRACELLAGLVRDTGAPVTLTLMGLGAYPAADPQFIGMLGMHGTYEANLAMHDCDVMVCIGARFDDRVTGRLDGFSPHSRKIHVDIDPSSINKNIKVDVPIVGDAERTLLAMAEAWNRRSNSVDRQRLGAWWGQIEDWRKKDSYRFRQNGAGIKPQYAIQRLYELTRDREVYVTTDVGQHQMWAAQHFKFERPLHWLTSGGLGTMGYGFPAAIGVQVAHPKATVLCISGDASWVMNMQEMSTAMQYRLPVKTFILNNSYMGMVRQWQEFFHGNRYSESYMDSLPDFVKLAEAFGAVGLRATAAGEVDDLIKEALRVDRPVLADIVVDRAENVYPMIPGGSAHNEIRLSPDEDETPAKGEEGGMVLV
jgi:acetolactate synthase-1/2/3 large subunit